MRGDTRGERHSMYCLVTRYRWFPDDANPHVVWRQVVWAQSPEEAILALEQFQGWTLRKGFTGMIAEQPQGEGRVMDWLEAVPYTPPEDVCIAQFAKSFERKHGRMPTDTEFEEYIDNQLAEDIAEFEEQETEQYEEREDE